MKMREMFSARLLGRSIAAAALAVILIAPRAATAGPVYSFNVIPDSGSSAVDAAIGHAQLSVEVNNGGTVAGTNFVNFTFRNAGPAASSITQIYFDDGSLLALGTITEGPGTDFRPANPDPGNLPRGNTINFHEHAGFSIEPVPQGGTMANGVNPGEFLTIQFSLQSGKTYLDTIALLDHSALTPTVDVEPGLRIGIHVQGYASGGSESFVNDPSNGPGVQSVPEPATVATALSGLIPVFVVGLRRRYRRSEVASA